MVKTYNKHRLCNKCGRAHILQTFAQETTTDTKAGQLLNEEVELVRITKGKQCKGDIKA